jgi:hypothetical protein
MGKKSSFPLVGNPSEERFWTSQNNKNTIILQQNYREFSISKFF